MADKYFDVALEIGQYASSPQEAVKMFMDALKDTAPEDWAYSIRENDRTVQWIDGSDALSYNEPQEFTVTFTFDGTHSDLQTKIQLAKNDGWDLIEAFDQYGDNV